MQLINFFIREGWLGECCIFFEKEKIMSCLEKLDFFEKLFNNISLSFRSINRELDSRDRFHM